MYFIFPLAFFVIICCQSSCAVKNKVLIVVPGFGYFGARLTYLVHSLEVAKNSSTAVECMVFTYADVHSPVPPEEKHSDAQKRAQLLKDCTIIPYYYANYGDYVKAVPPLLVSMSGYSHVMILLDDISLHSNFKMDQLIQIMDRNNLTIGSPAIHGAVHWTTKFHVYGNNEYAIGHVVDIIGKLLYMGPDAHANGGICIYRNIRDGVHSAGVAVLVRHGRSHDQCGRVGI